MEIKGKQERQHIMNSCPADSFSKYKTRDIPNKVCIVVVFLYLSLTETIRYTEYRFIGCESYYV